MRFKTTIGFIIFILCLNNTARCQVYRVLQGDTLPDDIGTKAGQLFTAQNYQNLVVFCDNKLDEYVNQVPVDSLKVIDLYNYKAKAQHQLGEHLAVMKTVEAGMTYCPDNPEGRRHKAYFYSYLATATHYAGKPKLNYNASLTALQLLSKLDPPDYDHLISVYRYLSQASVYHGHVDDGIRYLRQAVSTYELNRTEVDYSYDFTLLYSQVYQLCHFAKTEADSVQIAESAAQFETLRRVPNFDKVNDGIYYTTALNHIANWYATKQPEATLSSKDLELAHRYIDHVIDLVSNEGYAGGLHQFKYNKAKFLALSNELHAADKLITELLVELPENDGRRPYFLAQKGLVKAKKRQKDSAVDQFYKAISIVHSDTLHLNKDLNNFKPSQHFGHTKLLLRIVEELERYYPQDSNISEWIARLNYMAFEQFEHSYNRKKFNQKQDELVRNSLQGVLQYKLNGYNVGVPYRDLINRFENIQNIIAWQRFKQNRRLDYFPEVDSLQQRRFELGSAIAEAKANTAITVADSLEILIRQNEKYTTDNYPNFGLFDDAQFDLTDLQGRLGPNQMVIKYIFLEQQLAICTITNTSLNIDLRPWSDTMTVDLNSFTNSVVLQGIHQGLAAQIGNLILPHIGKGIDHIIVNPDGVLNSLPFELIADSNGGMLIEEYNISYSANLVFIDPIELQSAIEPTMAIYSPEYPKSEVALAVRSAPVFLEGAKEESELISQLFSASLFKGKELSKDDFIASAGQFKLLHLAMHAVTESDNDLKMSRLLFNPSSLGDKDLYLEELYNLNLNADLAVLSACNTAVNTTSTKSSSVEIQSFQRAFTFAGVPATVASLWEVPDIATKELMVNFYKNLKKGELKSQALRNAKLKFKASHAGTQLEQPYYWAGFVLYGADAPVVINTSSWGYWVFCLGIVILLFVFYWLKYLSNSNA